MKNPLISIKRRTDSSKSLSLVRYYWDPINKKRVTDSYGSISLSADPDDIAPQIKLSAKKRYENPEIAAHFSIDDLAVIRTWLLKNGDSDARELRLRRDSRVVGEALDKRKVHDEATSDEDEVAIAVCKLNLAGAFIKTQAEAHKMQGIESWPILRPRYLQVYEAFKHFQDLANEAGVTKGRGPQSRTEHRNQK